MTKIKLEEEGEKKGNSNILDTNTSSGQLAGGASYEWNSL